LFNHERDPRGVNWGGDAALIPIPGSIKHELQKYITLRHCSFTATSSRGAFHSFAQSYE